MPSRDVGQLHPDLRILHSRWVEACEAAGVDVLTTCTFRSQAEQDALWEQGRTKPGKIVTWTKKSRHSEALNGWPAASAWDFVPLAGGKPIWSAKHPAWEIAGKAAEALGLEWGGRWKKADMPHIQTKRG